MTTHTPGPWEARPSRQCGVFSIIMGTFYASGYIGEANARLIAAAPDLLEALKAIKWAMENDEYGEAERIIDDAVAKAEGGE